MQFVAHSFFMVILTSITFIKSIEHLGLIKVGNVLALALLLAIILALGEWPDKTSILGLVGLLIVVFHPWSWNESKLLSSRE